MSATVVGADGGNSKTELVVASLEGELLAHVRGPGSNSHAVGAQGCVQVLAGLVELAQLEVPAEQGAFFLCGADVPADIEELRVAIEPNGWAREVLVDNDTFGLLWAGTGRADAVAVVCGAGINCVGRAADGRTTRYPSLGWETGDWGGSEMLGREVLYHAARAEDGRGEPTALVDVVRDHFSAATVADVGEAIHYRRLPHGRVGELAPAVVAAAEAGDAVARRLVDRLAEEVVLLVLRALRDLGLGEAGVVLGGGLLQETLLVDGVVARLRERAPGTSPIVLREPPVLGAGLAALAAAGAPPEASARLRAAFDG
jgi:N-acetylglucosamine kinase-like BadF-type ATPase